MESTELDARIDAAAERWEKSTIKATVEDALREGILAMEQMIERVVAAGPLAAAESVKLAHNQRVVHLKACKRKLEELLDTPHEGD